MGARRPRGITKLARGVAAGLIAALALASVAIAAPGQDVGALDVGDSLFWDGDRVVAREADPRPLPLPTLLPEEETPQECEDGSCFEYRLDLRERGAVLRVAIDTPDCRNTFTLELVSPQGAVEARDVSCYSAEVYVDEPALGTWVARVTSTGSSASDFRMRAKLEAPDRAPAHRRVLLPNLRVEPPHEFGFGDEGEGLASESCYQEEIVEDGAQRCLRFSVGPQNTGAGPLELKFAKVAEVGTEASMYQRIYFNDGSNEMRPAGRSEFHKTHRHFHLKGFASFQMFRVTDRTDGSMVKAGTGNKSGFCLVDLRIARWRRFAQQRSYSARSNCMPVGGEAELGLSAGWTDVYSSELPGNYIDFRDNPDGRYVVRVEVDSTGYVRESHEDDNVGYAYIEVKGSEVTLLERGQGTGPWDPGKIVFSWPG